MKTDDDIIRIDLANLERVYYDPRADFWCAVALDEDVSPETSVKLLRDAEAIYRRARAFALRPGVINVRNNVLDVLRKLGA